ncbi:toprim domain-containing protein, partial [Candidatus Woesearchaeota archaeon]|nr:toprim domain-containing protein [Candidatus Woesearchaeota archaeon]
AETAIVAAALEIIQRIGPCNAKIGCENIEDVRVSKRKYVIERAKELLKQMTEKTLPDSQELADEVAYSVRMMEVQQYGKDRLAAGPAIDESDEITVVEGRADVLNLLKHGIKNAIAMNGTSCPETIKELSRKKILTAFVDGDRGGNLIIKELTSVAELDHVARAPDGKEVEELTKKEIHKALRGKVTAEQAKMEFSKEHEKTNGYKKPAYSQSRPQQARYHHKKTRYVPEEEKKKFKGMLEDLIGTRGAYILDDKLNILGKVPITELASTVKSLASGSVYAVVFDGVIDRHLVEIAEKSYIKCLVAMDNRMRTETRVKLITAGDL